MVRWATAAVVLIAFLVAIFHLPRKPGSAPTVMLVRGDINHDGQVDILDAFALARELKDGTPLGHGFDLNGDGVVDERDVATLAVRAVSLDNGKPL